MVARIAGDLCTYPRPARTCPRSAGGSGVRLASGRKRARQDVQLNAANTALRSKFRTVIKNVQKALDKAAAGGDKAAPAELFKTAQKGIDSVADKGIFHKNKAARLKSRLSARVKAMSVAAAA